MLNGLDGAFGEDRVAAGDVNRIDAAMRIDDDVQADDSTNISAL